MVDGMRNLKNGPSDSDGLNAVAPHSQFNSGSLGAHPSVDSFVANVKDVYFQFRCNRCKKMKRYKAKLVEAEGSRRWTLKRGIFCRVCGTVPRYITPVVIM